MSELPKEQACPYCGHAVEDHLSNWSEDNEDVECDSCGKKYTVSASYQFLGFEIKRLCQKCGDELYEDENVLTDMCDTCDDLL